MTSAAEQLKYHPDGCALAFTWGAGTTIVQVWGADQESGDLMVEIPFQLETDKFDVEYEQEPFEAFCRQFLGFPPDLLFDVESIIRYVEGEDQDDTVVLDGVMERLFALRKRLK